MIESKCTWCGDMFPEEESYHGTCGNCQCTFILDNKPLSYVLSKQGEEGYEIAVMTILSRFIPEKYLDGSYHFYDIVLKDGREAVVVEVGTKNKLFCRENVWTTICVNRYC